MKDDFYFWCFVLWFGSVLEWGWALTIKSKNLRKWIGNSAIIFNLLLGVILYPVLTSLSASLHNKDGETTFYMFIVNIIALSCLIPAEIFMAVLLKKSEKLLVDSQKSQQDNDYKN